MYRLATDGKIISRKAAVTQNMPILFFYIILKQKSKLYQLLVIEPQLLYSQFILLYHIRRYYISVVCRLLIVTLN